MTEKSTSRWAILIEIYLCMLAYAVVFQSIPPIMSLVIDHFHLSHHEAGLLMSMFALPGVLVSLPAGMLTDRFGVKPIGIITLILTIVGTALVATGQTFALILAGRIIAGTGAVTLVIISPQAIAQWFAGREMGIAMGVLNTAMPVGTIASLNAIPALASVYGWRAGIWLTLALAAATLIIFALFYSPPLHCEAPALKARGFPDRSKPRFVALLDPALKARGLRSAPGHGQGQAAAASAWNVAGAGLPIWMVGAAWALFNASIISLSTFAPDFMVSSGLRLESAGFDTSLVMAGPLLLSPVIGFLIDKTGGKEAFIAAGGIGMALVLLLFPAGATHFAAIMAGVGIMAALIPAPIFSLSADVVSPERLGVGYGILSLLSNLGIFVGPQIVGLARDATGSYAMGFCLMAVFAFLAAASIIPLWLRRAHHRRA
jgi:MFS family permease